VTAERDLVTGAFGNVGRAIADRLQERGRQVRTLTSHPPADPGPIDVREYAFDDPDRLAAAFDGVGTFYNTYWMRLGDDSGYANAVRHCDALITAAERAGVERIVHLSVIKPSVDSPYAYFRGKAQVEERLRRSERPVAVIRPALIFGGDSVLLTNLAWLLRRMPVFALPGDGEYRVRPVHVDDVARLCLEHGEHGERGERVGGAGSMAIVDAVGPERPTFAELVTTVRDAVGGIARIVKLPPGLVLPAARTLGAVLRDDLLNRDELLSTMDGLADSDAPTTGRVAVSRWIREHGATLGRDRVNERSRRR
jgi:NADH dehydrogenase